MDVVIDYAPRLPLIDLLFGHGLVRYGYDHDHDSDPYLKSYTIDKARTLGYDGIVRYMELVRRVDFMKVEDPRPGWVVKRCRVSMLAFRRIRILPIDVSDLIMRKLLSGIYRYVRPKFQINISS